jgi:hypothetical protein
MEIGNVCKGFKTLTLIFKYAIIYYEMKDLFIRLCRLIWSDWRVGLIFILVLAFIWKCLFPGAYAHLVDQLFHFLTGILEIIIVLAVIVLGFRYLSKSMTGGGKKGSH